MQYAGASYLAYIGIKTLLSKNAYKRSQNSAQMKEELSFLSAAKMGFLANILSPKAAMFFTSIFASLISLSSPHWLIGFLWIFMPINSFFMATFLSCFFTQKFIQDFYLNHAQIINIFLGMTLLALAGLVAFNH